jgi:hypothetical protein
MMTADRIPHKRAIYFVPTMLDLAVHQIRIFDVKPRLEDEPSGRIGYRLPGHHRPRFVSWPEALNAITKSERGPAILSFTSRLGVAHPSAAAIVAAMTAACFALMAEHVCDSRMPSQRCWLLQ